MICRPQTEDDNSGVQNTISRKWRSTPSTPQRVLPPPPTQVAVYRV